MDQIEEKVRWALWKGRKQPTTRVISGNTPCSITVRGALVCWVCAVLITHLQAGGPFLQRWPRLSYLAHLSLHLTSLQRLLSPVYTAQLVIFIVGRRVLWWGIRNSKWLSERVLYIEGVWPGVESQGEISEPVFPIESYLFVSRSVSLVFGRINIKIIRLWSLDQVY